MPDKTQLQKEFIIGRGKDYMHKQYKWENKRHHNRMKRIRIFFVSQQGKNETELIVKEIMAIFFSDPLKVIVLVS